MVATGHTATDQVETVLYRLAASPGRRALLGIRDRPGVIRPLLDWTREETAAHCREHGLQWREDPSNDAGDFARNRIRNELLPALRSIHPAAEANVLRTLEILRDEAEVLDSLIDTEPSVERIAALPPALRRLTVQAIAGEGVGRRPGRRDPRAGLARRHGHARPRRRPAGRGRVRAAAVRPRTACAAGAGAPVRAGRRSPSAPAA